MLCIQNEDVNEPFLPLGKGLEDDSERKRAAERQARWAYFAMAVSALFAFGAGFCVKAIYEWYGGKLYEVVAVRAVSLALFSGIYAAFDKRNPFRVPLPELPFLVLRILAGAVSMVGFLYALRLLPIGKAVLVYNINPIFTAVLCNIFLRESLPRYDLLPAIAAFLGIFLVAFSNYGADASEQFTGIFVVLVSAIACGCSNTLNRKMSKNVYFLSGTLYLAIVLVLACIVPVVVWDPAEVTTFADMELGCALFLAGFAVLAFASHLLMSLALKLEEGRKVSALKYT